ncbi:phospholipase D-like domain-containing protein [Thermodesulfobacteriota bacterium]
MIPSGEPSGHSRNALTHVAFPIDAQYYIWHKDVSGAILLDRLISAADRGVRVRILVDDTQIMDSRKTTAALNLHPNIEVRSFNPFVSKTILGFTRALEFVIHLDRLNHRMHNKLMVADNAVAIVI